MELEKLGKDLLWAVAIAGVLRLILSLALGTSMPLVAIMSNSMLHDVFATQNYYLYMSKLGYGMDELEKFPLPDGFAKGDVVVLVKPSNISVGDVVLYVKPELGYPIIHRVINVTSEGYITKGDRNPAPDPWVVKRDWIKGKAVAVIPFVGWIKVLPSELILRLLGAMPRGAD